MPYLTPAEISSHMYPEIVTEITRADATLMQSAINAAISEMRGYLSGYDITAILATTGDDREAILLLYTKDIAVWHFIQLANPNIEIELRERRYEFAIAWLKGVQKGTIVPNLPVVVAPDENTQVGKVRFGSNPKRETSY